LIYITNNNGPRVEPCGIPQAMFLQFDLRHSQQYIAYGWLNKM